MNVLRNRLPGLRLALQWLRDGVRVLFTEGPKALVDGVHRVFTRQFASDSVHESQGGKSEASAAPRPSQVPMLCWHLESPDITQAPANSEMFEVRGWIAAKDPIEFIHFADEKSGRLLPLFRSDRPDVTAVYGLPATGFVASCPYEKVRHVEVLTLLFGTQGREFEIIVPAYRPPCEVGVLKRGKLDRLRAVVQCPKCDSQAFELKPESLQCRHCGSVFPCSDSRIDFLTPELRASFNIVSTENVSSNGYDGEALNIIHRLRDGLILDCGAGLRDRYFANVVNYEIVPYDSTDVLGVGERLPFKDASFDAVFSFAVLEHVKDPFACSREILRVLKPGGTLYCQVPFLQPVHGYPHHYYNMTLTGMQNLFGDAVRIERAGAFLFGQPVFALSWILNKYVEGLPAELREEFKGMRVEQLLLPGSKYLGASFVTELSATAREELSCCNCLIATKVG